MQTKRVPVPTLSVVIPAYNEERYIDSCLKALTTQKTDFPYEIIVVNNNSTDNTERIVKKYPVRIIRETKKGYGEAVRSGVEHARAPLIALTDADTIANPYWVRNIVRAFQIHPEVVGIGGPFEYYDGPLLTRWAIRFINGINPRLITRSLCGMNMAYRKSAYVKVGGYTAKVNLQADTQLGLKLMEYGKVIFLRRNVVRASARRYHHPIGGIVELGIRGVNNVSLSLLKQPLFYDQTDVR